MPIVRDPGAPAPYQQIREILRQEILASMSRGDRIAAERDLARRFDANRATISRAINSLVKEGLLIRRVGRGTYVSNGEEGPRRTKTSTIGLVIPFIQGDFPAGIIRSAVKGLRNRGYRTVLFDSEGSPAVEASELDRLMQEGLDGGLIMPVDRPENDPIYARMIRLGRPIVFLDRRSPNIEADCVATDNFWGAYQAVSRLIERGHNRIAHSSIASRVVVHGIMHTGVKMRMHGASQSGILEGAGRRDQSLQPQVHKLPARSLERHRERRGPRKLSLPRRQPFLAGDPALLLRDPQHIRRGQSIRAHTDRAALPRE